MKARTDEVAKTMAINPNMGSGGAYNPYTDARHTALHILKAFGEQTHSPNHTELEIEINRLVERVRDYGMATQRVVASLVKKGG